MISTVWNAIKTIISSVMQIISSVLKGDWEGVKSAISNTLGAIKSVITSVWNAIKSVISSVMNGIKSVISSIWNGIKSVISGVINEISSVVSSVFNGIKNTVSSVFSGIWNTTKGAWNGIKTSIQTPIESARDLVKNAIDKIKGFFDFKISWPKIPMPHFGISPSGWKIGDLLKGSIPKLSIDWYATAMKNPMIMNNPTLFGYDPATGSLMGGGEAGSEVVSGTDTLMQMIGATVDNRMGIYTERMVAALQAVLEAIVDGNHDLLQALLDGQTIVCNDREIARVVREYA